MVRPDGVVAADTPNAIAVALASLEARTERFSGGWACHRPEGAPRP